MIGPALSSAADVTTLDAVTLGIAITGLVLSVVGLGLRIADFFRSGSRLKVELRHGLGGGGGVITNVVTARVDVGTVTANYHRYVFVVVVANTGHGATSVESVELVLEGGFRFQAPAPPYGVAPPQRLEGESKLSFYIPGTEALSAFAAAQTVTGGGDPLVWAEVTTGANRTVTSSKVRFGAIEYPRNR